MGTHKSVNLYKEVTQCHTVSTCTCLPPHTHTHKHTHTRHTRTHTYTHTHTHSHTNTHTHVTHTHTHTHTYTHTHTHSHTHYLQRDNFAQVLDRLMSSLKLDLQQYRVGLWLPWLLRAHSSVPVLIGITHLLVTLHDFPLHTHTHTHTHTLHRNSTHVMTRKS